MRVRDSHPVGAAAVEASARERAIIEAVRAVPRGEVRSYADIARAAGWPRHARLVARALARSAALQLPWHRVLRADGRIAFPEGSPNWHEQTRRLRLEGIELVHGRVIGRLEAATKASDLDAALWGGD